MEGKVLAESALFLDEQTVLDSEEVGEVFSIVCPINSKIVIDDITKYELKGYFVGVNLNREIIEPVKISGDKVYYPCDVDVNFLYVVTRREISTRISRDFEDKEKVAYAFIYCQDDCLMEDDKALIMNITTIYDIFELAKLAEKAIPVLKRMGYSGD